MNKKELQQLAQAAAKNIKTESDLNEFRQMLTKLTVETALNVELDDHLGFARHEQSDSANNRNGFSSKTIQAEDGQFTLDTPRAQPITHPPKPLRQPCVAPEGPCSKAGRFSGQRLYIGSSVIPLSLTINSS